MQELILLRGVPGSGKTTLAKVMLDRFPHLKHVESDMFWGDPYRFDSHFIRQAHEWCLAETTRLLYQGHSVIVSNTFTWQKEVDPYVAMLRHIPWTIRAEYCNCKGGWKSTHDVPEHIMEAMKERWEEEVCLS